MSDRSGKSDLKKTTDIPNVVSQRNISFDSLLLQSFFIEYPKFKGFEDKILDFYRKRNFTYVWFDNIGLIEQAGNLTNRILNLEQDGVFKQLSYAKELDSLVRSMGYHTNKADPNIQLELLLTGEYFVFTSLAWQGMNPFVSTSNHWLLPRKKVDYNLYLDSLLATPEQKLSLKEPVYRQYELLKNYLRKYRMLDDRSDWPLINGNAKKISFRDSALVISQIKRKLFQLEDYDGNLSDSLYDNRLRQALIHFQQRHGLAPTGKINWETIDALNVPLDTRIKQVLVNMERSRWLPVSSQGDYLAVNIPEFKLHVYHKNDLLWSCKVVVGKSLHPTTLFYGEINQVVFSPYWNIPESIVSSEILPGMKSSANYLARHRMETVGKRNGLPIVRQKPGSWNALGRVKFLFPNSHSIYLHDTPLKSLFKETGRAFSHGCIRVAEPAKLAAFLLKDDDKWNTQTINSAMLLGQERPVSIQKKIPIFIAYFTAFIDREGRLNFREDIYNLDRRLAEMIISGTGAY